MNSALIGFGRFGKLFYKFFKNDYNLQIYDKNESTFNGIKIKNLSKFNYEVDIIFFAIPISSFKETSETIRQTIKPNTLIVELSSIKIYPLKILKKYFPKNKILGIHPLFGPDSVKRSLRGHQLIVINETKIDKKINYVINSFMKKGVEIKYLNSREHDELMAYTLCLTQFIGRALGKLKLPDNSTGTKGYFDLLNIIKRTNNDTLQLFIDMNRYNPYSKLMRKKLIQSFIKIDNLLKE